MGTCEKDVEVTFKGIAFAKPMIILRNKINESKEL